MLDANPLAIKRPGDAWVSGMAMASAATNEQLAGLLGGLCDTHAAAFRALLPFVRGIVGQPR